MRSGAVAAPEPLAWMGDEPIPVNVRLIAASNRVPKEAVQDGKLAAHSIHERLVAHG